MKNRISALFATGKKNLLSVYYTAGFPSLHSTLETAGMLETAGADLLEIGIPYSDPIADGPTIQISNEKALGNGMTLKVLFGQLKDLRKEVSLPVLLMGYFNPIYQFGVELFCETCQKVGIDGLIIPDMPLWEYENKWKSVFEKYDLFNVFLVTPQTQPERIRKIDSLSESFIYLVSSASVTGAKAEVSEKQLDYFQRIKKMELKSPTLIGFGISNHATFSRACTHAQGAIVGSAFIQALEKTEGLLKEEKSKAIYQFVQKIKQPT